MEKLYFASDYMDCAHPAVLQKLCENNLAHASGYGSDTFSDAAREKIRTACRCPGADVYFLTGGTQSNVTVIDTVLRPWQGVISATSGHIQIHEAGAVEFCGHRVIALPNRDGKITAEQIDACVAEYWGDDNHEHMVMPGMVYLSQPTEYGTLYSLQELEAIRAVCTARDLALFIDGARLAYALACPANDVTLPDLARLCDVFIIGGTKCGTLFGEAVVIPVSGFIPHFVTQIKQHGALLAKGFVNGLQFDALFTDGLYHRIGAGAIEKADRIRAALVAHGYSLGIPSPTNQIFFIIDDAKRQQLEERVAMSFMERVDERQVMMRFCTSWATKDEDVDTLISIL